MIAFTGSRHPLRVFESTPMQVGNRRFRFAVSPTALECYRRLDRFFNRWASRDFDSLAHFLRRGDTLEKQFSGFQLAQILAGLKGATPYLSQKGLKVIEYFHHYYEPGFSWQDVSAAQDEWSDELATQVYEFMSAKEKFIRKMNRAAAFVESEMKKRDLGERYAASQAGLRDLKQKFESKPVKGGL